MRRRARRLLLGAAAVPVMAIAVLGAEVQMARSAKNLPDDTPLVLDGHLDGPGTPLRMLWLGDSTAAGLGASSANETVPRQVAAALHRQVDLVSLSVSGFRLGDVLKYQLGRAVALHPDIVLISIGANDVVHLTSRTTFRNEYERFVRGLPAGVRLVILGVPDMGATTAVRPAAASHRRVAGSGPRQRVPLGGQGVRRHLRRHRGHDRTGHAQRHPSLLRRRPLPPERRGLPALGRRRARPAAARAGHDATRGWSMEIDEVAARGFEAGAAAYEAARPGYPDEAIEILVERVGLGPRHRRVRPRRRDGQAHPPSRRARGLGRRDRTGRRHAPAARAGPPRRAGPDRHR